MGNITFAIKLSDDICLKEIYSDKKIFSLFITFLTMQRTDNSLSENERKTGKRIKENLTPKATKTPTFPYLISNYIVFMIRKLHCLYKLQLQT